MSDNKHTSLTPVIVGIVIALLGILTGLYIAQDAREQLAAVQKTAETLEKETSTKTSTDAAQPVVYKEEDSVLLPPLEPIVVDVIPFDDEAEEPASEETETMEEEGIPAEVDDFEEVPEEEIGRIPVQADTI